MHVFLILGRIIAHNSQSVFQAISNRTTPRRFPARLISFRSYHVQTSTPQLAQNTNCFCAGRWNTKTMLKTTSLCVLRQTQGSSKRTKAKPIDAIGEQKHKTPFPNVNIPCRMCARPKKERPRQKKKNRNGTVTNAAKMSAARQ